MSSNKEEFIERYRISQAVAHPDTFMTKLRRNLTLTNIFFTLFLTLGILSLIIYIIMSVSYASIKTTYNNLVHSLHTVGISGSLENTFFNNYTGQSKIELQYARMFDMFGPWIISTSIILIALAVFIKWGLPSIIDFIKERKNKKYE